MCVYLYVCTCAYCNALCAENSVGVCGRCMTCAAVNPFTRDTQQKESPIVLDKQVCAAVW